VPSPHAHLALLHAVLPHHGGEHLGSLLKRNQEWRMPTTPHMPKRRGWLENHFKDTVYMQHMLVCQFLHMFSYVAPLVSDAVTDTIRQLCPCHYARAEAASGISVKTGLRRLNSITDQQTAFPWQPVKLPFQMRGKGLPQSCSHLQGLTQVHTMDSSKLMSTARYAYETGSQESAWQKQKVLARKRSVLTLGGPIHGCW